MQSTAYTQHTYVYKNPANLLCHILEISCTRDQQQDGAASYASHVWPTTMLCNTALQLPGSVAGFGWMDGRMDGWILYLAGCFVVLQTVCQHLPYGTSSLRAPRPPWDGRAGKREQTAGMHHGRWCPWRSKTGDWRRAWSAGCGHVHVAGATHAQTLSRASPGHDSPRMRGNWQAAARSCTTRHKLLILLHRLRCTQQAAGSLSYSGGSEQSNWMWIVADTT